jgi:aldehyde:ferredoxin oxidoreductase
MANGIPGGYNGKILRVNLTHRTTVAEPLDADVCRKYLGGAGFIAYYLYKELKPGIDPLGPENKLIFALGPVTGLVLPGAARNCIGTKSPLTGGIAKAEAGGHWMAELKRAGFDAIIVEGQADKPVYLWIHDGEVEIKDAAHLWGKEVLETQNTLRAELGDNRIQAAMIGPAGENLVLYACIMQGCFDAAARGGVGAVMGSKNLKAVAVRGHNLPPVADENTVKEIRQQLTHPYPLSELGTSGHMMFQEAEGDLPVRNFGVGGFPAIKNIHSQAVKDNIGFTMDGCFACPVRCKRVIKIENGYKVNPAYGGPEYESMASLGSDCGVEDPKATIKANERCNAYSLDTISTGSSIAFAMECYEKGFITKEDTGGLELKWGDAAAMLEAIELIAHGRGFGKFLAQGTARMSKKIGHGSEAFAMHVKGLEVGLHDARVASCLALGYMTSPMGGDHNVTDPDGPLAADFGFKQFRQVGHTESPFAPTDLSPGKIAVFRDSHFQHMLFECLCTCVFPALDFNQTVEILKGVTGWDVTLPETFRIAERVITLMRLFNLREGISPAADKLPERFYQPTKGGALKDYKVKKTHYDRALKYYYALMGWDVQGVPLPEKVEELSIP